MIRHIFKLIWNKKKANALITIEILCSFLVLFAVVTIIVFAIENYRRPVGFTYRDVWDIDIDSRLSFDSTHNAVKRQTMQQLLLAIRQLPEIHGVCGWACPPYSNSTSIHGIDFHGKKISTLMHHSSEHGMAVLGLNLVEGRWFEKGDGALPWTPVVINNQFRHELFGTDAALGKNPFPEDPRQGEKKAVEYRIIGVIEDMRKDGELSEPTNVSIQYLDVENTTQAISSTLLINVQPGTTAAFKEKLTRVMESVAKGWSFDIRTLEEMRSENFKPRITFIIVVGLIAVFLLMMVALGLIGVLWQNVSRRTQEIGLRRALGGTTHNVYQQILGELLVLTTFGLLIGTVIVIQFPLLDLISLVPAHIYVPANVYALGLIISISAMYLLTLLCGLYPSWLTMDIEPAEALHYE